jgi:Tol biopolymer transport system component
MLKILKMRSVACLLFILAFACLPSAATAAGTTTRVSISAAGDQADSDSQYPCVSADGRFVAFESAAANLVPNDTNNVWDVFVHDRLAGAIERVSVSSYGVQGDGASRFASVSADGRFVAFASDAANLLAADTNSARDVFLRDRLTGTTERVSVSSAGVQADNASEDCSVSADGRFVAFESIASNLIPDDTNAACDIFVRDRTAQTTERVSVSSTGAQANNNAWLGPSAISQDGRLVAFISLAGNLVSGDNNNRQDIFVRDRTAQTTQRVSVSSGGAQGNNDSGLFSISPDGRYVAFESLAANLVSGDTNGAWDVFLHDRTTGETERVSLSSAGEQGNSTSALPWVSAGGRFVAFESAATNLAPGDTNDAWDVFVRDTALLVTERVSVSSAGAQGDSHSEVPTISADGRLVAFDSAAGNLVAGDTNNLWDIFLRDRSPDSVLPDTTITFGPCGLTISTDSTTICWTGDDNETLPQALQYSWRLDAQSWTSFSPQTCANLAGLSQGAHVFQVKAKDLAGNADASPAECQFTVDLSGPSVSITSPAHLDTVKGVVNISAAASHASGIQKVEFYADALLLSTDTSAPYSCAWDTRPVTVAEGPTQLCAVAYANGGKTAAECILVTVDNTTFDDVSKTSSQWPFVEALVREGITGGCQLTPPLYCPTASVTRAQMAKFLCIAAAKATLNRATPTFADVPAAHWAYGYVERLADAASWPGGAPTGGCRVEGTTKYFCPNNSVTREQMAKFLCLAAGKPAMPSCSGTFADVPSSNTFCPFIERLVNAASWPGGVPVTSGCACPSGYPPGAKCYCPKSAITRGQMAVFLVRAFGIAL